MVSELLGSTIARRKKEKRKEKRKEKEKGKGKEEKKDNGKPVTKIFLMLSLISST